MKNLIDDTIEKIKKQQIVPEPRWKFLVKKYGAWSVFGLIIFLGALSFSAAHYLISSLDWDLYRFMHQNSFGYFFSIFPFFWTVLIIVFLLVAFLDIRKTGNGYRFSWPKILLIVVGSVLVFGSLLAFVGFGRSFNDMALRHMPSYGRSALVTKESQWMQPEKGLLAGSVVSVSGSEFEIRDLAGKKWKIKTDEKVLVRPMANISEGHTLKILGQKTGDNDFLASEIRPWMGRGMMGGGSDFQGRGMPGRGMMRQ